jgi:hypothetical protein
MLRIPHYLDNRLTDGGKVVSPTHRPLLSSPETLFLCFWYSFLLEAGRKYVGAANMQNYVSKACNKLEFEVLRPLDLPNWHIRTGKRD